MAYDSHVGAAIRTMRLANDLTQAQLARRANVSLSLLGKVECGDRGATHSLLAAVARALGAPIERLTGQPYSDTRHDERTHQAVDAVRAVLCLYDLPDDVPPRSLHDLAAEVDTVARLRRGAEYSRLAVRLPPLLQDLTAAAHTAPTAHAGRVASLLVTVYHAAHTLLHRLGYADLAESVEHKLGQAAERAGDPLAGALARWTRVQSFQAAGDYTHGLRLMDTARADLDNLMHQRPTPDALVVYGSLHLRSVTLASRAGDADATHDHLAAARQLAGQLPADRVSYGLTFGAANCTTHDVAARVELGDPAAAVAAAAAWSPPRSMPRTRRGHHYLDLARAHLAAGDRANCLHALQEARQIAPQQTRLHPMVRDTAAILISQHRRSNSDLTDFAGWLGLTS